MKCFCAFALALLAGSLAAASDRSESKVTPVQKVLTLMNGMLEKGKKEKHAEEVQFAAYQQFCINTVEEKTKAIKEGDDLIQKLKADIENFGAEAKELTNNIAQLDADIAKIEGDKRASDKMRKQDHREYIARRKNLGGSVHALEDAIENEEQHNEHIEQMDAEAQAAANFVQVSAQGQVQVANPPGAHAYESHSGGIVNTLEKLDEKFIDKKQKNENEEKNSAHMYDMVQQDLIAQDEQAKDDKSNKEKEKGDAREAQAQARNDLEDATNTRNDDAKYMSDLKATCQVKKSDFESRQQLRAEEIEAIEKAVEIISSGAVAGSADKHLPSMLQGSSFAQLHASLDRRHAEEAARFLRSQGKELNSRMLSELATRVSSDPFEKVKKMIKDLLIKMMEEANEEAEHKGWCDTELGTNEQTRKEKTDAVETLKSETEELTAEIAKLTEDIHELTKNIGELDAAMAKANELRAAEKAKNTETIADAKAAQKAVAEALSVLREFYAKSAEQTALVQQEPEIFDSSYKGMQSSSGGVVGMLEVIESDFARLEADTKAGESSSQEEYDQFTSDSQIDRAAKNTDMEHKTAKKQDSTQLLTTKTDDLIATQKELDAAMAYFDKLKPSCVDSGTSYEDRVARRKAEIQSLKEALEILSGQDLA